MIKTESAPSSTTVKNASPNTHWIAIGIWGVPRVSTNTSNPGFQEEEEQNSKANVQIIIMEIRPRNPPVDSGLFSAFCSWSPSWWESWCVPPGSVGVGDGGTRNK